MNEIIESQKDILGITDFLSKSKEYSSTNFNGIDIESIFSSALKGKIDNNVLVSNIFKIFESELGNILEIIVSVLIVVIIHSILKEISENMGNSTAGKTVYFIEYMAIVTILINGFADVLSMCKSAISNIIDFMNLMIPIFTTLMLVTGNITTSSVVQPVLIFLCSFIGNFINNFLIPLLLISIALGVVSNISKKSQIEKISKFCKSTVVWVLGIILTIFTSVISVEGTLSSSVDGITSKTAKSAVSNFIPVVGKIMGDTVETIIGCGNILKNSVGIVGVVIILGIVLSPMIKVLVLWICFKITSVLTETIADSGIVKLIGEISDSYKVLLAMLFSVSVMFIIGITLVLKITNSSLMYK